MYQSSTFSDNMQVAIFAPEMNINTAANSRMLAKLIQNIVAKDRDQFIQDAKQATSMQDFINAMGKYRTIQDRI
jgi:hypothetical protein